MACLYGVYFDQIVNLGEGPIAQFCSEGRTFRTNLDSLLWHIENLKREGFDTPQEETALAALRSALAELAKKEGINA